MDKKIFLRFESPKKILPYLWGFAAAAALDCVLDVQTLFLPVILVVAMVSAASAVRARAGR